MREIRQNSSANATTHLREAIWSRLEERLPDIVAFCQRLVRTPSVNGEHLEAPVAEEIATELRRLGIEPTVVSFAEGRPCVVASVGQGPPGFLFVGHMDTVAVGNVSQWTVEPFGGTIIEGRLYGRGACDNKGGIALAVHLLGILQEFERQLRGRVLLACVPDEESGATGRLGITPLLQAGYLQANAALYTYPNLDLLCIGHRGVLRVRATAHGQATHTGGEAWEQGQEGINAVTGMAAFLLAVERWQPAYEPSPAFPNRRPVVTPGTRIHGGHMESMVPDSCEAVIDLRLLPGQEPAQLLEELEAMAAQVCRERPGLRFDLVPFVNIPAVAISPDLPIVQALAHWTEVLTGQRPRIAGAGPANEGYLLIQAGIPTICGFGPPGGNAHAADEYVEVEGLLTAGKVYAAALLDWLEHA